MCLQAEIDITTGTQHIVSIFNFQLLLLNSDYKITNSTFSVSPRTCLN